MLRITPLKSLRHSTVAVLYKFAMVSILAPLTRSQPIASRSDNNYKQFTARRKRLMMSVIFWELFLIDTTYWLGSTGVWLNGWVSVWSNTSKKKSRDPILVFYYCHKFQHTSFLLLQIFNKYLALQYNLSYTPTMFTIQNIHQPEHQWLLQPINPDII